MRTPLCIALLSFTLLPGCVVAAGALGGVLISQQALEDSVYIVQVRTGVATTWSSVKTTMSHMSLKPTDCDNEARTVKAEIDSASVTVTVQAYDLDQSTIKVSATKYGLADGDTALMVKDKLLADLERKN
jgi:hypothetical protein